MKIKEIISHLESIAPLAYQESYDNSGLLVGDADKDISKVLITLDVTEKVIEEAIENECELIIAHHPLIFSGLKKITGSHWVERCIIKAIQENIAIYAIHTNLDNILNGVNGKIAERLGLINCQILSPKSTVLMKLDTFVPKEHVNEVLHHLYESGAGKIGYYDHCSFRIGGTGSFRPLEEANPTIGERMIDEQVEEDRIELLIPSHMSSSIIQTLKKSHPYEEVAYYLSSLENKNQFVGSGLIGELKNEQPSEDFLAFLKAKMNTGTIRHTPIHKPMVQRIAVCGGSGSFLLKQAKAQKADVFITGDFKYHDFFEAENQVIIADIGHYESEQFTKELLYDILSKKFANIALRLSEVETNPIKYL